MEAAAAATTAEAESQDEAALEAGTRDGGSASYDKEPWLSYLTYSWMGPLVTAGSERQVHWDDTPPLAGAEDAVANSRPLLQHLHGEEQAGRSHPLIRAVAWTFWSELLLIEVLRGAAHFLGLAETLLMQQVLVFQEAQQPPLQPNLGPNQVRWGFIAIATLISVGLFSILFNSQLSFFQNRLNIRIGSALRGLVLVRSIRGRHLRSQRLEGAEAGGEGSAGEPSVYNLLSFDVGPNIEIIWIVLGVLLFPLQFGSTFFVLFSQVGQAAIPGLITIIVAKLVVGVLLYRDAVLRHRLLECKDVRLRRCDEGFHHIRTIQMLAWLNPFQRNIMEARDNELAAQNLRLWMSKMAMALDYSLSAIVTFVTLAYYVAYMGRDLKASVAIPVIALINGLGGPIGQFPTWMNSYLIWRSAYVRVNEFLGITPLVADLEAPGRARPSQGSAATAGNDVAAYEGCTLTWATAAAAQEAMMPVVLGTRTGGTEAEAAQEAADEDEEAQIREPLLQREEGSFVLRDLDLHVGAGQLLVLVGKEGQGKSSFLLGLLGEMATRAGTVRSPAITRWHHVAQDHLCSLPLTVPQARTAVGEPRMGQPRPVELLDGLAVPFVAQTAALFTESIRANILFGLPHMPGLYGKVLQACALEEDVATMPLGDLTEVAQGGANLSGGQKVRVALARAVYCAVVALELREADDGPVPLVLLDDPLSSLDHQVAQHICSALLASPSGLLAKCAVVVATADPWWLHGLRPGTAGGSSAEEASLLLAVLRGGAVAAAGSPGEVLPADFPELRSAFGPRPGQPGPPRPPPQLPQGSAQPQQAPETALENPQDDDWVDPEERSSKLAAEEEARQGLVRRAAMADSQTQTELSEGEKKAAGTIQQEHREEGQVKLHTYLTYLNAVGYWRAFICALALIGIMVFQNLCNLWVGYWAEERKGAKDWPIFRGTPPNDPLYMLKVCALFTILFTLSNFAGHSLEILGGVTAARKLFREALEGTLGKPFRWWDVNPTGRVLNRFSEDVKVMDEAITNIMGVIFGAVLYFLGHAVVLALISNPFVLVLIPFIGFGLEYYAQFYRRTIRELQRNVLVQMGLLYQDMTEAIACRVTVNSFSQDAKVICKSMVSLERYQQVGFAKSTLDLWLGLRMSLISFILGVWAKLQPMLQYYSLVDPRSAALIGLSITYSQEIVGIMQQFISNYSSLEMQLISIERLGEYAAPAEERATLREGALPSARGPQLGLCLQNVTVTYRDGLKAALTDVSLSFAPREVAAVMGRTGAGKTSMLLAILQLIPYTGHIWVDHCLLQELEPERRASLVGVVPQQPVLFQGSLRHNLDPEGSWSDADLWKALVTVGLDARFSSHSVQGALAAAVVEEGRSGTDLVTLSKGQQQLLCAARVLLRRPRVALLDEVSSSLPAEGALAVAEAVTGGFKNAGAVVLLVTHQEHLLPLCERVLTVADGRVVGDSPLTAAADTH